MLRALGSVLHDNSVDPALKIIGNLTARGIYVFASFSTSLRVVPVERAAENRHTVMEARRLNSRPEALFGRRTYRTMLRYTRILYCRRKQSLIRSSIWTIHHGVSVTPRRVTLTPPYIGVDVKWD